MIIFLAASVKPRQLIQASTQSKVEKMIMKKMAIIMYRNIFVFLFILFLWDFFIYNMSLMSYVYLLILSTISYIISMDYF